VLAGGGGGAGERNPLSDINASARFSLRDILSLCGGERGQDAPAPRTEMTELVLVTKQEGKSYCSYNSFKSGYDITLSLGFFWLMGSAGGTTL